MENNQKWSQAKSKKIIARLLVDVETQIIPHLKTHLKTKEGRYPTKKMTGKPEQQNVGKKIKQR